MNDEAEIYVGWFKKKIVDLMEHRMNEGATKYGELLPPEHDDRDFAAEALEELVDAVFYVQRLELQRRYLVNENQRLMAKLARVRADEEREPAEHKFKYRFDKSVPAEELEGTFMLAMLAVESLHGRSRVRMESRFDLDTARRTCVIDVSTEVGSDLARIFTGFATKEYGERWVAWEVLRG